MRLRLALLPLLFVQSAMALGQRVELPIREVDLSDGMRRYAVTLDIDGKPIEAALDTGSSGLRVLAPRLSDSAQAAKGHSSSYGYRSGAEFKGQDIKLPIAMGAISANAELMRVDAIGCRREKPSCPMGGADLRNFGIMGDMLPGQGFAAIIGTAVNSNDIEIPGRTRRQALDRRFAAPTRRNRQVDSQSRRCRSRDLQALCDRRSRYVRGLPHRRRQPVAAHLRARHIRQRCARYPRRRRRSRRVRSNGRAAPTSCWRSAISALR